MKVRHPFGEPPYQCEHDSLAQRDLVASLTHYDLDNGHTVSVLHAASGGWEAWAWPTALGSKAALTMTPRYYDSEAEALMYRDKIAATSPQRSSRAMPRASVG